MIALAEKIHLAPAPDDAPSSDRIESDRVEMERAAEAPVRMLFKIDDGTGDEGPPIETAIIVIETDLPEGRADVELARAADDGNDIYLGVWAHDADGHAGRATHEFSGHVTIPQLLGIAAGLNTAMAAARVRGLLGAGTPFVVDEWVNTDKAAVPPKTTTFRHVYVAGREDGPVAGGGSLREEFAPGEVRVMVEENPGQPDAFLSITFSEHGCTSGGGLTGSVTPWQLDFIADHLPAVRDLARAEGILPPRNYAAVTGAVEERALPAGVQAEFLLARLREALTKTRSAAPDCVCMMCLGIKEQPFQCEDCGYAGRPITWPCNCHETLADAIRGDEVLLKWTTDEWPKDFKVTRAQVVRGLKALRRLQATLLALPAYQRRRCTGGGKDMPDVRAARTFAFEGNCSHGDRRCPVCSGVNNHGELVEHGTVLGMVREINALLFPVAG